MKRYACAMAFVVAILFVSRANALPVVIDPTVQPDAATPILISSIFTARGQTFVELHNQSEKAVNLSGWTLRFVMDTGETDVVVPDGWILPDEYFSLVEAGDPIVTATFSMLPASIDEVISEISLLDRTGVVINAVHDFPSDVTVKWYQRKSSGLTGVFTNDFSAATSTTKLRHTPLFQPPLPTELRIVEVYPHASDCAPNDTSTLCGDYIKLYNPTDHEIDPSVYRLRSDSSTSESSNAFHLDAYLPIAPHGYVTVSMRDDSDKLSLTDSGGYVWLEDWAGIQMYDETITNYPSAGSESKIGYAWALADDGTWQWTSTPNPAGANSFPQPAPVVEVASVLADCPEGKYRSPETNRCRTVAEAVNELAQCEEGQERNPATNRCRSIVTASTTLTPCDASQERNPATNRCRQVATTTTALTPCLAGQERNPETNRCRKVTAAAPSTQAVTTQKASSSLLMTSLLVTAGIGAAGYGVYEWRSEIWRGMRRLVALAGRR